MTSLESTTPDAYSEEEWNKQQLKFLTFIIEKSKENKKLLGYLQVLSRQFGEVEQ